MEFTCKLATFTFTKVSILIHTSPRHKGDVLGQANIDIPGEAADFSILGVYWADINGVSVHLFLEHSTRVFLEVSIFLFNRLTLLYRMVKNNPRCKH
jgi:hypothetical protein